ncbi:serine/threonine protein kinase, partial [Streptomyces sp. SID7499]|nr:serine/threonine protein kinase [Streptomyces sp. SID7499]
FRTATGARKALTAAVEMLPDAGPDDEPVEVFDQIGPLPPGFGPDGPVTAPQQPGEPAAAAGPALQTAPGTGRQPYAPPPTSMSETGSFHLAPPPEASPPRQQPHQQPGFPQPGFQQTSAAPFTADAPL